MRFFNLIASAAVSAAALTVTSSAFGAAWLTPTGSTSTFTYSGGLNDNGLFGDPFLVTDAGFSFAPAHFTSSSANGVSSNPVTDRMQVQVDAKPNAAGITGISLNELGDYVINDGGSVKEYAYLIVRVLDANYSGQRVFTVGSLPGTDVDTKSTGGDAASGWSDKLSIALPTPARSVLIILNNNLLSGSIAGGSATITKKLIDGDNTPGLNIQLPEPATLTAGFAALGLVIRRRRAI